MKRLIRILAVSLAVSAPAMAAIGAPENVSLLASLFLGFAAFIVMLQIIPAIILFVSMVQTLFVTPAEEEATAPVQREIK